MSVDAVATVSPERELRELAAETACRVIYPMWEEMTERQQSEHLSDEPQATAITLAALQRAYQMGAESAALPLSVERACEILSARQHNGWEEWRVWGENVTGNYGICDLTGFEAGAIAAAYEREAIAAKLEAAGGAAGEGE